MAYFVTGGTGFIGRFLVQNLLKHGEPVYLLVRKSCAQKASGAARDLGRRRQAGSRDRRRPGQAQAGRRGRRPEAPQGQGQPLFPSRGDIRSRRQRGGSAAGQYRRHAPHCRIRARRSGRLLPSRELDRGGRTLRRRLPRRHVRGSRGPRSPLLPHQALAEGIVRSECKRPWRIYRPGFVVGHRRPATSTRSTGRIISSS